MDRLDHYRQSLKKLLKNYADSMNKNSARSIAIGASVAIEVETVFDADNDHYLLLNVGWQERKRVHHCILHFDIKDGKIWLQENNTDIEVDEDIIEMGISKQEMVIGFHHPSMREYSDYAIA